MCNFASIVLTKDRELWSDASDSHEEIIRHNNLVADGARGPNILRVEVSPGDWTDLKTWSYRVDQDILPEWHNPEADEARARAALKRRMAQPHWRRVRRFINSIKIIPWCQPDGRPLKTWRLFSAAPDATYGVAYDAAYAAASGGASHVARRAARDAARSVARHVARDAAYSAAYGATYAAASGMTHDAAYYAARRVACDASRDAALYSAYLLAGKLDRQHASHIKARWRVWRKGYCLRCDVDGTLYVYTAKGVAR